MLFSRNKKQRNKQFANEELTDAERIRYFHQYKMYQYNNEDYQALGWRDVESQQVRFKVLASIGNLSRHTLLDAGCGHGDLRAYLDTRFAGLNYYGMEQMPEFVAVANQRYANRADTMFTQGDFMADALPAVDYILVNGSLNYRNSDPDFIFKAIERLFSHSRLGLAFNLLSRMAENEHLVAYPPEEILAHCRTLTPQLKYRDDYADEDYTIFMYHQ